MIQTLYGQIQQISIDQLVNNFVQYFKNTGELKERTLAVPLTFTVEDYDNDKKFIKQIILLYHGCGYTTVAWTTESKFEISAGNIELNFEVCHDSCWRDGTSRIIEQIAKDVDEVFDENDSLYIFNFVGTSGIELLNIKIIGSYETQKAKIYKNNNKKI